MTEDRLSDYEVGSPAHWRSTSSRTSGRSSSSSPSRAVPRGSPASGTLVPGVTSQVLRDSLRELVRDGIVVRQEFVAVPPHVEYTLTDLGASLCEPARAIRAWAERHGPAVIAARRRYDRSPQWR